MPKKQTLQTENEKHLVFPITFLMTPQGAFLLNKPLTHGAGGVTSSHIHHLQF